MTNKILIVEDDPRVSELLQRTLLQNQYDVDCAYDGESAFKLASQKEFDLVVTDIMLPKLDGISLAKKLRSSQPQLPILMLTALGETDDKLEGFDAGADDYMVKPFEVKELLARVKVLLKRSGKNVLVANTLTYANVRIDRNLKKAFRDTQELKLTPKEYNLLEYLVNNADRVITREEISKNVWNTHFDTGTNFIDVYINYLRKKVDKNFEPKLIKTRSGMGFIFTDKE